MNLICLIDAIVQVGVYVAYTGKDSNEETPFCVGRVVRILAANTVHIQSFVCDVCLCKIACIGSGTLPHAYMDTRQ